MIVGGENSKIPKLCVFNPLEGKTEVLQYSNMSKLFFLFSEVWREKVNNCRDEFESDLFELIFSLTKSIVILLLDNRKKKYMNKRIR